MKKAAMKTYLTLLFMSIFSGTIYSQSFSFSNPISSSWTFVDDQYPGLATPPTPRIDISNGTLNFINTPNGMSDVRAYHEISTLCDYWVSEFQFEFDASSAVKYIPFAVTENNSNPSMINTLGFNNLVTNNNVIGVLVESAGQTFFIQPFYKLGNTSIANTLANRIYNINPNVTYDVILERLDLTHGKITVKDNNGFYETRCFDIDASVGDLKYLQHSNNPLGGWGYSMNSWVDNVSIMNCIQKNNCCLSSEIMGVSEMCLPNSNSAFYSVNNGADSYNWSVTGGATISSGHGTNMIEVNFTNATGPVNVAVDVECGCTVNSLTKTITGMSDDGLFYNNTTISGGLLTINAIPQNNTPSLQHTWNIYAGEDCSDPNKPIEQPLNPLAPQGNGQTYTVSGLNPNNCYVIVHKVCLTNGDCCVEYKQQTQNSLRLANINSDITNIDEISITNDNIKIYPNPSKDIYWLEGVDLRNSSYSITYASGQVIKEKQALTKKSIDMSNEKSGVYLLKIYTGKKVSVFKLIKE